MAVEFGPVLALLAVQGDDRAVAAGEYTVSAAPSNAEEPRNVLPSLPAWCTPRTTPRPPGVWASSRDHGVDDDTAVLGGVLVGSDHAAGQGVEDDEAVAAPVDEGGQVADFEWPGEVHRERQDGEVAVADLGVPACLPRVDAALESERAFAGDVEGAALFGGAALPVAAGGDATPPSPGR